MRQSQLLPKRELLFGRLVLIYQMPDIGSQTIEATLNRYSFPGQILRFHFLSSAFAKTLRNGLSSAQADSNWKHGAQLQLDALRQISRAIRLRRILSRCGFGIPKVEVITGVRELIGLVLASIFENYAYFATHIEEMTEEKCRQALLHPKTFKTLRDWFDLELKSFTGTDVFEHPFPCEQGHAVYENSFARILVYRFEALNQLPVLLSNFLHWEIPALVNCNLGESKQYAERYAAVKEQLRLPLDFVRAMYEGKAMRHFYSDAERHQLCLKWGAPQQSDTASSLQNPV